MTDEKARRALAKQILAGSDYDFGLIGQAPQCLLQKPDRHGVRVIVAPTDAFPSRALDALRAWRLGQYLLTGFYDAEAVQRYAAAGRPLEEIGEGDVHAMAIDRHGAMLCYVTMKKPPNLANARFSDSERALFPCEEIHGRTWERSLTGLDEPASAVWELARFCKDQRRGRLDVASQRAPVELGLALARLVKDPANNASERLFVGDFDPHVALRSVRYFFVPVATFPPVGVDVPPDHPLRPRYSRYATAPFAASPDDIDYATYLRWVDIDLALSTGDLEAHQRLVALQQIVSVKESRLKRPLQVVDPGPYPPVALQQASSAAASAALWEAASGHAMPGWEAVTFGPGEAVAQDRVTWVLEGYVQAFIKAGRDRAHLGGIGPEVAFVPRSDPIHALEAATPVRALVTHREAFEEFWQRRQQIFETAATSTYGSLEAFDA